MLNLQQPECNKETNGQGVVNVPMVVLVNGWATHENRSHQTLNHDRSENGYQTAAANGRIRSQRIGKMKKVLTGLAVTLGVLGVTFPASADCGRVTISEMNWASASIFAHIDQYILSNGYGCEAELVPGDTMPTSVSMIEKSEPDIAPEMWINSIRESLDQGVSEGKIEYAGKILTDGGQEGWWVPRYMVEKTPELATVSGLLKHPELFPNPEDPSRGLFMNCPSGWNCQIINDNLFEAFDLNAAGFDMGDPGSAAGLDGSLTKAYERGEGWLGYYWAPTAFLGKFDMVKVDFEATHDDDEWNNCIAVVECSDPKPNDWLASEVYSVTSKGFATKSPDAYAYVSARSFENSFLNKFLKWADENQVGGEEAAEHFLKNNESIWTQWVSPEVASKVKSSLSQT